MSAVKSDLFVELLVNLELLYVASQVVKILCWIGTDSSIIEEQQSFRVDIPIGP